MASQCSGTASIQHRNIRLPDWFERWLQPVLVTVDMHRVHHSIVFDQANSNYRGPSYRYGIGSSEPIRASAARSTTRLSSRVRELPRRDCLKPSRVILTPWLLARTTAAPSTEVRTRGRLSR